MEENKEFQKIFESLDEYGKMLLLLMLAKGGKLDDVKEQEPEVKEK